MGASNLILDHKPLVNIFNDHEMNSITNPQLMQLKDKTLMYGYKTIHAAGRSKL